MALVQYLPLTEVFRRCRERMPFVLVPLVARRCRQVFRPVRPTIGLLVVLITGLTLLVLEFLLNLL